MNMGEEESDKLSKDQYKLFNLKNREKKEKSKQPQGPVGQYPKL